MFIVDMERIYLVTLAKDTEPPFGPRSDEVGKAEQKTRPAKGKGRRTKKNRGKKITYPSAKVQPYCDSRVNDKETRGC